MRIFHFSIFIYILVIPTFIMGQAIDFKGKAVDEEGLPIPGATVLIVNGNKATATQPDGSFIIHSLPLGEYQVEVRSMGRKTIKMTINLATDPYMDFVMEENTLGLEQVVITGTMQPVFVSHSPVKIEVVTAKHLNTYLPAAASGIMEGIALINGVQEVIACGVCFTNSISINGLPGPYTAVLLDGTPMFGNLASVYGLNGIPSMIIDRFEVIKGPTSTLYGSEAVAGVINIITKDPSKQPEFSFDIMATSHLESFGNLAYAPKMGKASGFVGLNYAYINNYEDDNNDGFNDMVNLDRISLFSKWDFARPSEKKWTLAGKYYFEDRRNGVRDYLKDRRYKSIRGSSSVYGESIFTKRAELFGSYELNSPHELRVDYSLSIHNQNSAYGSDFYFADQWIAFMNFIYTTRIRNHSLTSGMTMRYQFYDDNTVATSEINDNGETVNIPDRQFIPGIFVQDEFEIKPFMTLLGGIRLDNYTLHGPIVSPRFSVKVNAHKWTTFRLNSGTGFRVVNLFAEDHAFITGQRTVEIKENLEPERSYNFAFSINHVYTLGESQGMIDLDAYYTHFINKIIPDYSDPGKILYSNSEGYALTKGVGINLTQELMVPVSFNAGVNFQRAVEASGDDVEDILFAPEWSGVFNANYNLKSQQLTFAYSLKATGPMALPEVYDLDKYGNTLPYSRPIRSRSFAIHNVQVRKDFSHDLSIYGGIQNIFDFKPVYSPLSGYNDPFTQPGFSDKFDTSYAFAPVHGREFYVGVMWQINKKKSK